MKKTGKRTSTIDFLKLLDAPATWVVRARSGVVGNASCLRAALEIAARKAHRQDPVECIVSASRFDNRRVQIYPRQIRNLLQKSAEESIAPNFSASLFNSDAPRSIIRRRFLRLGRLFSHRRLECGFSRAEPRTSIVREEFSRRSRMSNLPRSLVSRLHRAPSGYGCDSDRTGVFDASQPSCAKRVAWLRHFLT